MKRVAIQPEDTIVVKKVEVKEPLASVDAPPHSISSPPLPSATLIIKIVGKLPIPLQHLIAAILMRGRDAQPEVSLSSYQKAEASLPTTLGWLPMLTLIGTCGVFLVAYACTDARNNGKGADFFFWLGLLLIFVPPVVRLLSPVASRFERISLLCVVGLCLYLVNVSFSPLYFSSFDELLHWRTANDIINSGHLFTTNVLLPVGPFYPGLEIVTNAFARLSGLNTFIAGLVVVGVARLVIILSLFLLYELIMKSARMAGLALILYIANPHFLFFDAQFSYESLALSLATAILFVIARQETLHNDQRRLMLTTWFLLGAVVVTHHVTDFIFEGFLLLWVLTNAFRRLARIHKSNKQSEALPREQRLWSPLLWTALFGVITSLAWINLPGNPVFDYLSTSFTQLLNQIEHLLNHSSGRQLFVDYTGQVTPLWERLMALSSVALISLCLPFGLLCLWLRYRFSALVSMFSIVALLYPFIQVIRLTNSGGEISDRASAFIFIPLACVLAIFITQFWPIRKLNWQHTSLITLAISVVFVGSIILGNGPAEAILPGPYQVVADGRSIEPEGIQSAMWTYTYLGPNNRMDTDRINRLLMSVYGDQRLVTPIDDKIDEEAIFFSSNLGPYEISALQQAKLHYLVVDLRLSQGLPYVGFYFDSGEVDAFQRTTPLDIRALTKFNTVPGINRVYDSGDIVIYDVGGLSNAPKKP